MKIIDQLKKVNLIQFVPAIFVISLVGNSVFGYTAPKSEKSKNNSENQVEAATTQAKKKTKKAKTHYKYYFRRKAENGYEFERYKNREKLTGSFCRRIPG